MRHIRFVFPLLKHRAMVTTLDLCAHLCAAAPTARSAAIEKAHSTNVARTRAPPLVALLSCLRRRGLSRSLPNLPPLLPPGESGERGLELPPWLPLLMESGARGFVMADMCVCVCVGGCAGETQRRSSTPPQRRRYPRAPPALGRGGGPPVERRQVQTRPSVIRNHG